MYDLRKAQNEMHQNTICLTIQINLPPPPPIAPMILDECQSWGGGVIGGWGGFRSESCPILPSALCAIRCLLLFIFRLFFFR